MPDSTPDYFFQGRQPSIEKEKENVIFETKKIHKNTPLPLEAISDNIKLLIFSKMEQRSFIRMRRTSKGISQFIDINRMKINVCLFDNWSLQFRPKDNHPNEENFNKDTADFFMVFYPPTSPSIKMNSIAPIIGRTSREIAWKSEGGVWISLIEIRTNESLLKELKGFFNLQLISFSISESYYFALDYIVEFIDWNGIQGVRMFVDQMSFDALQTLCKHIEPFALEVEDADDYPTDFLKREGFQNIKELCFRDGYDLPLSNLVHNLESLQISTDDPLATDYIFNLIDAWTTQTSSLNEIVLINEKNYNSASFKGLHHSCSLEEAKKLLLCSAQKGNKNLEIMRSQWERLLLDSSTVWTIQNIKSKTNALCIANKQVVCFFAL